VPESDWLNQNTHRDYPFPYGTDFAVSAGAFDGKAAFADAGFTLGISSAFVVARDSVYLERYYKGDGLIRFVFRTRYGELSTYDAMQCYEWVFEFPVDAPLGATAYAIPTRVSDPDLIGDENAEMGTAFLAVGDLATALDGAVDGNVSFPGEPTVEPAILQSNAGAFVNSINLANESRPCPAACDCSSSSSSSSESSSSSSSSSSGDTGAGPELPPEPTPPACDDPVAPEPSALDAPVRLALPNGRFVGAVKLKPGYNCRIDVIESQNIVRVQSGLYLGEGMQCEDLRTDADGNPIYETCRDCGDMVYAVESHGFDVDELQLVGGPGVVILPDADKHRIVVRLEEEGVCGVQV